MTSVGAVVAAVHLIVVVFGLLNGRRTGRKVAEIDAVFKQGKPRAALLVNFVIPVTLLVLVYVIVCHFNLRGCWL